MEELLLHSPPLKTTCLAKTFLRQGWTFGLFLETYETDLPFETKMNDGWDCKMPIKISRLLSLQFFLPGVYQEINNDYVCFFLVLAGGTVTLRKLL